jgi:FtsZ-interacting cell division protein ZipA
MGIIETEDFCMLANSDPATWYIIGGVVIVLLVVVGIILARRNRSAQLQKRFGSEYDRTLKRAGSRDEAERVLAAREARVKKMHLEELPKGAKTRYVEEWRTVQSRFVDEPKRALTQADSLVTSVMRDRGYPMDTFEQRVADLSPDHPGVVHNYRAAHSIAVKSERGDASTEDLRQAMVHYRSLFDELVGADERHTA